MRPNQTPCGYLLWHLYASGEGCLGRCLVSQNRRKERGASLRLRGLWIPAAHAEPRRRWGTLGLAARREIRRSERRSKESDERPPWRELARPKAILIMANISNGTKSAAINKVAGHYDLMRSSGAQARAPNVPIAVAGSDRLSPCQIAYSLVRTDLTLLLFFFLSIFLRILTPLPLHA